MLINDYIEDEHYRIVPWEYCIVPSVDTGLFDPNVAHAGAALQPVDFRYQPGTGAPETCWPVGIDYVVVNGEVAVEGRRYTIHRRPLRPCVARLDGGAERR